MHVVKIKSVFKICTYLMSDKVLKYKKSLMRQKEEQEFKRKPLILAPKKSFAFPNLVTTGRHKIWRLDKCGDKKLEMVGQKMEANQKHFKILVILNSLYVDT